MTLKTILPLALAPFAAASMLLAQAPPPPAGPGGGQRMGPRQGQQQGQPPQQGQMQRGQGGAGNAAQGPGPGMTRVQRMAQALKLTPDQQQKARTLFRAEATASVQAHRQARNAHEALQDSVRAGASDADIDRLAQAAGVAQGQAEAIKVKTMTKFYAMLTQEQKDQFDERGGRMMGGGGRGQGGRRQMGGGPGGGMGMRGPDGPGGPGGMGMRGPGGPGGPRPPREEEEEEQ